MAYVFWSVAAVLAAWAVALVVRRVKAAGRVDEPECPGLKPLGGDFPDAAITDDEDPPEDGGT